MNLTNAELDAIIDTIDNGALEDVAALDLTGIRDQVNARIIERESTNMIQPLFEDYVQVRICDVDNMDLANEIAYELLAAVDNDAWRFNFIMASAKREINEAFA